MIDPDEEYERDWAESQALDALVDQMREERHFDGA